MNKIYFNFLLIFISIFFPAVKEANGQIVINEYSCANLSQYADYFSKFEDWVELYNSSNSSVNIGGYHLSDDVNLPNRWTISSSVSIPAHGFIIIYASGRDTITSGDIHTNFKLTQTKNTAEIIVLSDASGNLLDSVSIIKTKLTNSRGRKTDGDTTWCIFTSPTFKTSNNSSAEFSRYAEKPDADFGAGYYPTAIVVTLASPEPNSQIRYTTNGLEPTSSSTIYTTPISISTTQVLKAICYSSDPAILPSFTEYNTYFISNYHTLPVMSIAGDNLTQLANGNQNLRPKGSVEFFDRAGIRKTKAYGEYNSHGRDSWANDQRSLDLIVRDEMGYASALKEKFFDLTDREKFQRLILRAAGDDNYPANHHPANVGSAHLRDAYVENLAKRGNLNLDVRTASKAVLYINGQYWGVYDLRERPDEHDYTEYYYGQGKYDIEYILTWGFTWEEYGIGHAESNWAQLYNYIMSNNMADPVKFGVASASLDVNSLVDYVIVNEMTVCTDWLNYNTGWWRGSNPNGTHKKWGYILWDNDATFDFYVNYTNIPNTQPNASPCDLNDPDIDDPENHLALLNKLRQNSSFNQYYKNRYIDLLNTVFSCDNMLSYLDSMITLISPEMAQHSLRWSGTYAEWYSNTQLLRNYIANRCTTIYSAMNTCFQLTGPYPLTLNMDPAHAGHIQINSLTIDQFPWHGNYFGGIDILLNTVNDSASAYNFDKWTSTSSMFLPSDLLVNPILRVSSPDSIVAHYIPILTYVSQPNSLNPELTVYPTIVNTATNAEFNLIKPAKVSIKLYSLMGVEVVDLLTDVQSPAGHYNYTINFNDSHLPAGNYVIQFRAGDFVRNVKLVYIPGG